MAKEKYPVTPAIRALRAAGVEFEPHLYDYVERGGTAHSAAELGVPVHQVVKTIVLITDHGEALLVLMHGDRDVSTKGLARHLGHRGIRPCTPQEASKHTGYLVGGTSPFGTRHPLATYMESSIAALPWVLINGGKRGFLVKVRPADVLAVTRAALVDVAVDKP